jgi:PIN domain nuclease of toxin-antitoxin system
LKLLLDTHIWVWALAAPEKLRKRVAAELENGENELWLSPMSVWEVLILVEKRRLELPKEPARWIRDSWRDLSLREAPLTVDVAIESRSMGLDLRDPVDRFLAATAKVHGLTLVTADRRLIVSSGFSVLANR